MNTNLNLSEYWDERELVKAVAQDAVLQQLLTWSAETRPDPPIAANLGKVLKFYCRTWSSWRVDDRGLLW